MYQIKFTHSEEVLVETPLQKEAEELLAIYKSFFGEHSVILNNAERRRHTSWAQEYKNDYISYFGELQKMGNLL